MYSLLVVLGWRFYHPCATELSTDGARFRIQDPAIRNQIALPKDVLGNALRAARIDPMQVVRAGE